MDLQHQILLEVMYEVFENTGMPLRTVTGSQMVVLLYQGLQGYFQTGEQIYVPVYINWLWWGNDHQLPVVVL
ncbi:hypothetical protein BDW68DRAFT_182472 [Aspergillus falconensis]